MLAYYFDNFMLIRLGEQKAATDLNTVIKYMHARGREINSTEIHSSSTLLNFLWALRFWAIQDIPSKVKKVLYLLSFNTEKEVPCPGDLFGILKQSVPPLGWQLRTIYQDCLMWGGSKQLKARHPLWAVVTAALPLGLYNPSAWCISAS